MTRACEAAEEAFWSYGYTTREARAAFLDAIANKTPPVVSGEDGRRAVETALMITESLRRHQEFVRERSGDAVLAAFR